MKFNKNIIMILFALVFIGTISNVYATDMGFDDDIGVIDNNVTDMGFDDDIGVIDNNSTGVLVDEDNISLNSSIILDSVDDFENGSDLKDNLDYKTFEYIQNLIDNAENGAVLNLEGIYYGVGNSIIINKSITIIGNDTTLDAKHLSGIFEVNADFIYFININFINGNSSSDENGFGGLGFGGAIYNRNPFEFNNIFVFNSSFENNMASNEGGAIFGLKAYNSIFINNTANIGGAVSSSFGLDKETPLVNCTFINNTADYGGALSYVSSAFNCIFNGNIANIEGNDFYDIEIDSIEYGPILIIEDVSGYSSDEIYINIKLLDLDGNPLANKTIYLEYIDLDDWEPLGEVTTDEEGMGILNVTGFRPDIYECNGIFQGDDVTNSSNICFFVLKILKYPSKITVDEYHDIFGNIVIISANVSDENGNPIKEGTVTFNDEITVELVNGIAYWRYFCEDVGNFTINAVFNGFDTDYYDSKTKSNIIIDKRDIDLKISVIGNSYRGTKIKVTVLNSVISDDIPIILKFSNGKTVVIYTVNNVAYYDVSFVPGVYNVIASVNFVLFNQKSVNTSFNIDKRNVTISIFNTGNYYKATNLKINLSNINFKVPITLKFSNGKIVSLTSNTKGIAYYDVSFVPGKYKVSAFIDNNLFEVKAPVKIFTISKTYSAILTPIKLTTTYNSGKYFQIKVTKGKNLMSSVKLKLKVFTGRKYKTIYLTTGSNGIAKYSASKLGIGTHKVIVSSYESTKYMTASSKTSYIIIKKSPTIISSPKVTNKYKTNAYFKATIKNKVTGKIISGIYVKIKIYTGKHYKSYTLKTNTKGMVQLNTKYLSKGSHKVVISSSNKYYTVTKSAYLIVIY